MNEFLLQYNALAKKRMLSFDELIRVCTLGGGDNLRVIQSGGLWNLKEA